MIIHTNNDTIQTMKKNLARQNDWICTYCQSKNFAQMERTNCYKCGRVKSLNLAPVINGPQPVISPDIPLRIGDWRCKKCNNPGWNFAARNTCKWCGSDKIDKIDDIAKFGKIEPQIILDNHTMCAICVENAINVSFKCGHATCDKCSVHLEKCHICRENIQPEDVRRLYIN